MSTWNLSRNEGRAGTGNWEAWGNNSLEPIYEAADDWKVQLTGIDKPWLCWHLNDDWCKIQQKLVLNAGWTPVVGNDTGSKNITVLKNSIYIDFNSTLKLPSMWMHFPLEFTFLFAKKLAFWHSDLVCSDQAMKKYSQKFTKMNDGETFAVKHLSDWRGFKEPKINHYGELLGCTTASASKSQFDNGCGWWRHIEHHPNHSKHNINDAYYEHGTGIYIWKKVFGGKVKSVKVNEEDGHATVYRKNLKREMSKVEEMEKNFDLQTMCKKLKITQHLDS